MSFRLRCAERDRHGAKRNRPSRVIPSGAKRNRPSRVIPSGAKRNRPSRVIPSVAEESKDLSTAFKVTKKYHVPFLFLYHFELILFMSFRAQRTPQSEVLPLNVISSGAKRSREIYSEIKAPFSKGANAAAKAETTVLWTVVSAERREAVLRAGSCLRSRLRGLLFRIKLSLDRNPTRHGAKRLPHG